jgi:hypothetical protein
LAVNNSSLSGQQKVRHYLGRSVMKPLVPKMVRIAFTPDELNYLERLEPFRRAEGDTVDLDGFERLCTLGNDLLLMPKAPGQWSQWLGNWSPNRPTQSCET